MGDISHHFNRYEVECKCGCGLDSMDAVTLQLADESRDFVGHSITPSSGCRCYAYNRTKEVGSNDRSQHPRCRAMDLPVQDPRGLWEYLCQSYPERYGFILYNTFVHVDSRSGPKYHKDTTA